MLLNGESWEHQAREDSRREAGWPLKRGFIWRGEKMDIFQLRGILS